MATIFPDQVACGENIVGDREIPDHPLVRQTIDDCLHEAMDIDGLERVLDAIEHGKIRVVAREPDGAFAARARDPGRAAVRLSGPDAPLEERRTQAVLARRWIDARNGGRPGQA